MDTGKTYDVVVMAGSKTAARTKGVAEVAKELGVTDARLVAKKPEISHAVN